MSCQVNVVFGINCVQLWISCYSVGERYLMSGLQHLGVLF